MKQLCYYRACVGGRLHFTAHGFIRGSQSAKADFRINSRNFNRQALSAGVLAKPASCKPTTDLPPPGAGGVARSDAVGLKEGVNQSTTKDVNKQSFKANQMFNDATTNKVLTALATASPTHGSVTRRQVVVNEVRANLGLNERELKQALEDLERAGEIRRVHLDLGCVLVTQIGRVRADRLARARELQEMTVRQTDGIDISALLGGV